ncbi:hypothetical protein J8281_08960 [Aquimarina sp. U1-2]|uniref:hypothetical protein n=1 Tax=Aquimarina sp. U1-2 TaxID=2823141 RepID=UPI001AECA1E7|nr:hypothetical protein [Aquimarina sp. U1-2]MBP2832315.1 hypothetical protein [Aquimarina sp. U1-2]
MKKGIVILMSLIFLVSCKSRENSNDNNDTGKSSGQLENLKVIEGKVVDPKRKPIAYVAIKLYLDDNDCMNAYTSKEGTFQFKLDEFRIKEQSHFEIVYKGYTIHYVSLRNFQNGKSIILNKKGEVVPAAEYHVFYESIKSCGRKS